MTDEEKRYCREGYELTVELWETVTRKLTAFNDKFGYPNGTGLDILMASLLVCASKDDDELAEDINEQLDECPSFRWRLRLNN